jgi:O-acetyl-ADP-ribose deacetylase (regulator of RNase III)
MTLDRNTINPFLPTRAALLLVKYGTFQTGPLAGEKVGDHVRTVAFPEMGTGVGRVTAALCARQMRAAFDQVRKGAITMPSSWAEASERALAPLYGSAEKIAVISVKNVSGTFYLSVVYLTADAMTST